jgi:hypothetical protein
MAILQKAIYMFNAISIKDQENVVFIHMGFYSAMKKNEILSFASKWMELENFILSEVGQPQKTKKHMFSLICGLQI